MSYSQEHWMSLALEEADKAFFAAEVPVGAVVVKDGELIARAYNQNIYQKDPTAHAEIQAMRIAAETLGNHRLVDCDLYVTIEPCSMCVGAMVHARIRKIIFGATEPKAGAVVSHLNLHEKDFLNHKILAVGGVLDQECSAKMSEFFALRRKSK